MPHDVILRTFWSMLYVSGAPLWEILEAGEWRSPAFMNYIDLHALDTQLVVQAHVDEESSDEEHG